MRLVALMSTTDLVTASSPLLGSSPDEASSSSGLSATLRPSGKLHLISQRSAASSALSPSSPPSSRSSPPLFLFVNRRLPRAFAESYFDALCALCAAELCCAVLCCVCACSLSLT
jgi:hypothetical protein